MSGLNDGPQRQQIQAMYTRWNSLRVQLGPAVAQNEEFIALSQTLQQLAARQRAANQGQSQFGSAQFQQNGANSLMSSQLGQCMNNQMNNQMNSPMSNQMNSPMSNQMSNQMGNQIGAQMGNQMGSQMPNNQLNSNQMSTNQGQMGPNQHQMRPGSQSNAQLNYMGPQMNGMPPHGNSRIQTPMNPQLNSQLNSQMGTQMNSQMGTQMNSQMNSPMNSQMNSQMGTQMGTQMNSQIGFGMGPQMNAPLRASLSPHLHQRTNSSMNNMTSSTNTNLNSGINSRIMTMNSSQMSSPMPISGGKMGPMNSQMGNSHMRGSMGQVSSPINGQMAQMGSQVGTPAAQMGPLNSHMGLRMNISQGTGLGPNHMRINSTSGPQMTPNLGMTGFSQPQQQNQQPSQGMQGRRPEPRAPAQDPKRKPTKAQQQAQQRQAQQIQQRAQMQAQQRAQLAQAQAEAQQQQQARKAQEAKKPDESSQNGSKDGLGWLNLEDIGGDLDLDASNDIFGDGNSANSNSLFYDGIYSQGNDGDDGLMSVLNDMDDVRGPDRNMPQRRSAQNQLPMSMSPQLNPSMPQKAPDMPQQGSAPGFDQMKNNMSIGPQRPMSTRPVPPNLSRPASRVAAGMTPGAQGSNVASPASVASPQMMTRRPSFEPTGSLLQHSPALSQSSFPRNTPQATPVLPNKPPPPSINSHISHPKSHMGSGQNSVDMLDGDRIDADRQKDHLLTPDELLILNNQDFAYSALKNGQPIPENVRNVLFASRGPAQRLPHLSQFQNHTSAVSSGAPQMPAANMLAPPSAQRPQGPGAGNALPNPGLVTQQGVQSQQQRFDQMPGSNGPGPIMNKSTDGMMSYSDGISSRDSSHAPLLNGDTSYMGSSTIPQDELRQGQSSGQMLASQQRDKLTHIAMQQQQQQHQQQQQQQHQQQQHQVPKQQVPQQPQQHPSQIQTLQLENALKSSIGAATLPNESRGRNNSQAIYDRELPAQLAEQMPQVMPLSVSQQELKKEHLEQHNLDRELSMKLLKNQQWQAQQRQEEMFRERYAAGDSDDVAFVIRGGKNLNTSSRSRRLTSSSGSDTDIPTEFNMLSQLGFDCIVDPQKLIPKSVQFEDLEKHDELLTIPSLFPIGVSGQQMKFERNKHIERLQYKRMAELEVKEKLSLKEEVELRQLRLQPYLKAVRGDLITHIQYFNSVAIDRSNRVHFARMKLLTQHDAALVERFVNEQALERRKSENLSQYLRVQRIQKHKAAIVNFEAKRENQKALLASKIVRFHQHVDREERKRYERTAKQRLQLLRANDEEAYLKLIDQTKDARITHLLKQTNKFLAGLAKAVKDQQGEELGDIDESEDVREKVDYYEVAHRIKEKVTEQPSILVGGKLKEYQIKGLQWMVSLYNNNLNGILADEMGLGKTIQSISLIAYLVEVKKISGPFLVLVPLSTLTNWNMEFDLWAPSINKIVYRGPPASRKVLQPQIRSGDFQVLLTTYEYVIKERPIFSRIKWEHMIIDEGHRMKNAQSKLSSTLAQYYTSKYRLILTGTPLQNNLPELWALLNFVLPKIFNSVKSFEEWFNKPFAQAGSTDRMDLGEEEKLLIIRRLHKVLRPFLLRRLKKDVEQDLPDKVEKVVKCRKSALQSQLYRQLLDHNAFALGSAQGGVRSLSNRVMQLRKLCNHPFVFEEVEKVVNPSGQNNDLLWRVSGKLELLDRILPKFKATGHRTLMFFQMTQIMDIMEDFLRLRGLQYLRLDGTTKAESRSELLRLFNEPNSPYFCFLLSTRAGGLGLNLQTADTVIIYDTDWNPHQDLQAQDRAHRIGQTKEVRILRLITENSIEENILERAQGKLDIDGKVIQAGKFDNKSTNEEQEAFLRTLLEAEEGKHDSKDLELDEPDDEELNSMLARSEEERQLFIEMDRQRIAEDASKGRSRLFSEQELPEQYTSAHIEQQLSEASAREVSHVDEGGHHLRTRRAGNWTDVEEELPPRKRSKHLDDSPSPALPTAAVQASAPPALPNIRTGRKGRPPRVKETMTPEAREQLTEVGRRIVKRMKGVTDAEGRKRIDLFLELPSRSHYPDYYQVIGVPMCVATIVKRLNSKYYQSFEQLSNDWRIIFRNARWYNSEGSIIYDDATSLEEAYEIMYRQLTGVEPPPYVDVVGDQPEKLNLQKGLPTQGTVDKSIGANLLPKNEVDGSQIPKRDSDGTYSSMDQVTDGTDTADVTLMSSQAQSPGTGMP